MRKLFRAAFYRTENKKMIRIELVIAVLLSHSSSSTVTSRRI